MKKANAELENRTLWLGWWLQKFQDKPFYYNNSAVLLPLLSQAIKGKANHYRFNQRAKLWRMTIHSSFHITAKSYLGALNSKAVLSFSQGTRFYQSISESETSGLSLCEYIQRGTLYIFLWQIYQSWQGCQKKRGFVVRIFLIILRAVTHSTKRVSPL